jgi:hypothetical protein
MAASHVLRLALFGFSLFTASVAYPSNPQFANIHPRDANSAEPILPSQDPFYTAPSGYELTLPGSILRLRIVPGNLSAVTGNCSASYHVLYRTTDSTYRPAWAVTTLFMPQTLNSTNHTSLLSYQIPYDSASIDGSPSFLLSAGGFPDIGVALGQGWVVNVPDFEGSHAAFGLGITEGYAVLDSIRAVQSLAVPTFTKQQPKGAGETSIRTALWGYSGGSLASLWALELHAGYAPDLHLHGAAVGGIVANVTSTLDELSGTFAAGLLPSFLLGITALDTTARAELVAQLKPANASIFLSALNMSFFEADVAFAGQDVIADYFVNGLASILAQPEIKRVMDNNDYSGYHGIPQVPLFVYKAIGDELAPIKDTDELIEGVYCRLGVDVRYERNTVGGHMSENANGVGRSRQFLTWVLDGIDEGEVVPIGGGCSVANVTLGVTTTPP